MSKRKLPPKDDLERLYWDEGLCLREIGERYDVTSSAVQRMMQKEGIERRSRGGPRYGEQNPNSIGKDELLDDIIAARLILGVWPTSEDYKDYGTYAVSTYRNRFGGFSEARERAKDRFEKHRDEWPDVEYDPPEAAEDSLADR